MFPSFLVKHRLLILSSIALFLGAYGLYHWGYTSAEQKYKIDIANQQAKIAELKKAEATVEKEIVTVYKDRVKTVTNVRDRIIEATPNVLREESMQCSIGPGFISLHNAAASNQALSESSNRVDARSTESGSTTK